jgi:hypothetical protein
MPNINPVTDVLPPVVVSAADIVVTKYQPKIHEYVCYGLTAIGYLAGIMGWGRGNTNKFLLNLGMSSLPLTVRHIYDRVAGTPLPFSSQVATSRLAFHPAPAMSGIRQTTTPEFTDVRVS